MKTYLSAVCIGLLLAVGASGTANADGVYSKPAKDVPIEPPCCEAQWGGFYVAGSVGYGISTTEVDYRTSSAFTGNSAQNNDVSSQDVIGTVGGGYDRDFGGFVVGVFADYTFGELKGSGTRVAPGFTPSYDLTFDDAWAVGGRLGLARSCCTMLFVTAGYTESEIRFRDTASNSFKKDLEGYFVGGGMEQKLKGGLSLKMEYRYSDYDNVTLFNSPASTCCTERLEANADNHAVRIGLSYRFGFEDAYIPYK